MQCKSLRERELVSVSLPCTLTKLLQTVSSLWERERELFHRMTTNKPPNVIKMISKRLIMINL